MGSPERPTPDVVLGVEAPDGHSFDMCCFGESETDGPVLLIWPAMGTKGRNYLLFAEHLSMHGVTAVVGELRGHGSSSQRPGHGCNYGYREMLQDWHTAVTTISERYPGRKIYLVGHSLGGQLSLLYAAANADSLAGVILIASCSVYYRCFGKRKYGLRLAFPIIATLATVLGYFPGNRVGFAKKEGKQVMRDWIHQGKTGRYEPRGDTTQYEDLMGELEIPVLVLEAENDHFAPPEAVSHLVDKLRKAQKERHTIYDPQSRKGFTHFDWFRHPKPAVDLVTDWLGSIKKAVK